MVAPTTDKTARTKKTFFSLTEGFNKPKKKKINIKPNSIKTKNMKKLLVFKNIHKKKKKKIIKGSSKFHINLLFI